MKNKVLITGATGFIGSHLTELCIEFGYDVKAFDRYNPNNHWGWLENSKYKNNFEVVLGDIRDYDSVNNAMQDCDSVFHLAALIGIPYSYVSPLAYIRTNVEGTYNVLEAARQLAIENILVTSTSEVYGTAQYVPIDENHPMVGQSPYSASKIAADQVAISYFLSFGLPVKIVRPFNTFGPRQSARAVIPTVISQLQSGKKEIHMGNLTPTRDFTYVEDTCLGFIEILKSKNLTGEVTNIGMNREISIENLTFLISKLMGKSITIRSDNQRVRPDNSEVERLRCDNAKLLKNTAWGPRFSLETGLQETIQWIEANQHYFKPEMYSI